MAANPKVKFTVDASQLDELKRKSSDLYNQMQRDALSSAKTIKGANDLISEQIKLLETQKRLQNQSERSNLKEKKDLGQISNKEYRQQLSQIKLESQEFKTMTTLLKSIADSVKNQGRDLADELSKKIGNDPNKAAATISDLEGNLTGSSSDIMSRRIAAQRLRSRYQNRNPSQSPETNNSVPMGGLPEAALQGAAGLGLGGTTTSLLTKAAGGAGLTVAAIAGAVIGTMKRQGSMAEAGRGYGAITGAGINDIRNMSKILANGNFAEMGYDARDFFANYSQYSKSFGKSIGVGRNMNLMGAQKALDLDEGQIVELLNSSRFGGRRPEGTLRSLENFTRGKHGDISLLGEYLNQYSQVTQGMLGVSGAADSSKALGAVQWMGRTTEGPQLSRILGGIQGVGGQGGITQSLMYRAARQANPNASTWELGRMIENPFENPDMLKNMFSTTEEITGGGESQKYLLKSMFPQLSKDDIDKILQGVKGGDLESTIKSVGQVGGGDWTGRARELTSGFEEASNKFSLGLDNMTNDMREWWEEFSKSSGEYLKQVEKFLGNSNTRRTDSIR